MITLTIDLTPTEQERVTAAARQKGLEPAEFIKQLVTESLPPVTNGAGATSQATTVEEKMGAMEAVAETNPTLPVLPDQSVAPFNNEANAPRERDPELVARVKAIRGKYAYLGVTVEDLHQERQADKRKEEVCGHITLTPVSL